MIAVDACTDPTELDALRDRWDRLWSLTPEPSFSQTFDWFRASAGAVDTIPRVFIAKAGGKLVGVWPTFERSSRGPIGRRRHFVCGGVDAPASAIVGPAPAATAAIVARHLRDSDGWNSLTFTETIGRAERTGLLSDAFAASGLAISTAAAPPIGEIELSGRWADILDFCDERTRLAIYRTHYERRDGGFRFERERPAVGAAPPKSIREAVEASCRDDRSARERLVAAMGEAAKRGAADIALLRFRGELVAVSLSCVGAAGIENRLTTIADGAPPLTGVRLLLELLRDGIARGDRRYVFTATPGHPAVGWSRRFAPRRTVRVEPAEWYGNGLRRLRYGLRAAGMRSTIANRC